MMHGTLCVACHLMSDCPSIDSIYMPDKYRIRPLISTVPIYTF